MNRDKLDLWKAQGLYVLKNRRAYLYTLGGLAMLVLLDLLIGGKLLTADGSWWKNFLDPIVGLGTLLTAIAVWLGEASQDWRNSLPKRLTVEFWYKGKLMMRCEEAWLAGESDIRALGQQIGGQMAAENLAGRPEMLAFQAAAVHSSRGEIQCGKNGGYLMHYQASFKLIALPPKLQGLSAEEYLLWKHPFDKVETVEGVSPNQPNV